jgi:ribosomal-protein-alanine N-acetyltransferase
MSAVPKPLEARLEPLTVASLDTLMVVEQQVYEHPWSRGNFLDALSAGYESQLLLAGNTLLGYFVALKGVDEVHLLNITVAHQFQRQGWARVMLDALAIWSRGQGAQWLWLEARHGNTRAIEVYEAHGFHRMGVRKGYYPAADQQREDAVVMSLKL